jgi:GT2 family glycosyltransferase
LTASPSRIGVVAIGRNEGERLRLCLTSVNLPGAAIVYVDSASTDGSAALATSLGAHLVDLDLSTAFTAARARNEGLERLLAVDPSVDYIQFVDGDCELEAGWIAAAAAFLDANPRAAVACGRRRERFPEASFYNGLCDAEWNTPVGEAAACGGDALFRRSAIVEAGGYNPALAAGEEPELCHRMRRAGWTVWRLDQPMTIHDAAMLRFGQWWRRAVRSGLGYAQAWQVTRRSAAPLYRRETLRALFWTLGIAAFALIAALIVTPWALLIAPALWALQYGRLARRHGRREGMLLFLGKFAETRGIATHVGRMLSGRAGGTIFYK